MANQSIGIGSAVDDGTGDTLRVAIDKVNDNFLEIYTLIGDASSLTSGISATATVVTLATPTITGTATMADLDISGDVDIDGTLEADAITIDGVTLAETISDTVGAMVGSNTETGITVSYVDGDNTLDFVMGTTQSTITSLTNAALVVGRDADNDIDFATDNNIIFRAGGADQIKLIDGALAPVTDSDIDLGTSSLEFKDAFFDGTVTSDAFAGPLTGEVTGNAATATTLATARTIGGTSFNGSANIAVALSATATALATARTIGGTSFDGTGNIAVALALATVSSLADTAFKSISTSVIEVAEPITKPSNVTVPSKKASLNSKELVPKSISLSVVGIIAPSCNLNCSVDVPLTSIENSITSLVVSIKILFKGVVNPASPINPITGPSAAVPSCLCPELLLNADSS